MVEEERGARRYRPEELGQLDLRAVDGRIVWAHGARASSEYSSSYGARAACGLPRVFPKGGDEYGTWLAESSDRDPWIELELGAVDEAHALLVCETCGPGAVREIRDVERGRALYEARPRPFRDSRKARLLVVPLDGPPPRRVRIRVASYELGSEYKEIDAVGLSTVPFDRLREESPSAAPIRHARLHPSAARIHDLRRDRRILWARGARASSRYSSDYGPQKAVGAPNVYPKGGDLSGTWCPSDRHTEEWLEVDFPEAGLVHGILVCETCSPGAIYKMTDEVGETVWVAPPEDLPPRKARLLHVALDPRPAPRKLRLHLAGADDYRQIDGVALLTEPLARLATEAPPEGTPEEGWTRLEGTLAEETDFVHATLSRSSGGIAATAGGPLRLRLDSGEEVALDVGEALLLGPPRQRARGPWAEVRARAPELAGAFAEDAAAPDEEVLLAGRRLVGARRVVALGEPRSGSAGGGFRDAARPATRLEVTALAEGSPAIAQLAKHSPRDFAREASRLAARKAIAHPLSTAIRGLAITALVGAVAFAVLVALGGDPYGPFAAMALALCAYGGVLAADLFARAAWIPAPVPRPGAGAVDRKIAFATPFWTLSMSLFVGLPAALVLGPLLLMAEGDGSLPIRVVLLVTSLFALVRVLLFVWRHGRALVAVLPAVGAPTAPTAGRRVVLEGTLAAPGAFSRTEDMQYRSEHLGSYTTTDDQGRRVTEERYRSWSERRLTTLAPSDIALLLPDRRVARAVWARVAVTDLGLSPRANAPAGSIGVFESRHEEGDPAVLVGEVAEEGEAVALADAPTLLILGTRAELRRRVGREVVVLVALLAVVAGCAAGVLLL